MKRRIRTLVAACSAEEWHAAYSGSLPEAIELDFLAPGQRLADRVSGVEVLYGDLPPDALSKADSLRWVQLNSTGADQMFYADFVKRGILLTSLGAAITGTVAEHALALLLALARNLHLQRDRQHARQWEVVCGVGLEGMRLGILGFGRIGRAIASRAQVFGMEITAVDIHPVDKPDCLSALWGLDRLPDLLRTSDALICAIPGTSATFRMIAAEQIACMPRGCLLVNISRGCVVDEAALVAAVRSGQVAGAGIDVTETEPCPPESPLWTEPGILLTPHSAGFTRDLHIKKTQWVARNLERYVKGEALQGLIDLARGY